MSININSKQDYSMLFNSISSSSRGPANFLGINLNDYSTIKSGSYGKLMKAYYRKDKDDSESSKEVTSLAQKNGVKGGNADTAVVNKTLSQSSEALKSATDELSNTKKDAVLSGSDDEAKTKAVTNFVDRYNSLLSASAESNNKNVISSVNSMANLAKSYEKNLNSIGISIDEDNRLKVDKEAFAQADAKSVANVFQGAGSFGYGVSLKASMVDMYAKNDAEKQSGLYGGNAKYDVTQLSGNFYTDLF